MSVRLARPWLAFISLAAAASGSGAQTKRCDKDLTVDQCLVRLAPARRAAIAAAISATQQRSTGGDSPASTPATSITNYLPRLAAAITAPGLSGDTAALGLNLNIPLNDGVLFHYGLVVQVGVVAHRPQLFSQLVDSLPASNGDAVKQKLQSTLNDLDDAELTLAVSADNKRFGRRFSNHDEELNRLAGDITRVVDTTMQAALGNELKALTNLIDPTRKTSPECKTNYLRELRVGCLISTRQDSILDALLATADAQTKVVAESKRLFHESGFDRIADLVDNQPQISLSAFTRNRRDLVGPSSFGATAKFEYGFANLNGLRRHCGGTLEAKCFSEYMNNGRVAGSLARGDRVALTVDFASQPRYDVARKDTLSLSLAPSWKLAPTATYGFYLGKQPDGTDKGRFDVKAQFVRQFEDAHRQNRAIIQMMLTEPVSDQSSAIFGVTWANRPEFVGETDATIRANVGLSYHLVSQPK